jgi:hypothetical protein
VSREQAGAHDEGIDILENIRRVILRPCIVFRRPAPHGDIEPSSKLLKYGGNRRDRDLHVRMFDVKTL